MNHFNINKNNLTPHFIGAWQMNQLDLCDEIINYFEININKQKKGMTAEGLNQNIKKSIDISILPNELNLFENMVLKNYISYLYTCYTDYLNQWPFLTSFANKLEIGTFNIQRYQSGEHFQQLHSERTSIATLHRVLVWMTYLNDVEDGGSTHFSHYDLDIQPQKGLTLIWPAEWTHAHKGNILNSGSKYIITGWMDLTS